MNMSNMIKYEWDYETVEDGDVTDHCHSETLAGFEESNKTDTLVLVRNSGNEVEGMTERSWAYVRDGKLPEFFTDDRGNELSPVPKRFHAELAKYTI